MSYHVKNKSGLISALLWFTIGLMGLEVVIFLTSLRLYNEQIEQQREIVKLQNCAECETMEGLIEISTELGCFVNEKLQVHCLKKDLTKVQCYNLKGCDFVAKTCADCLRNCNGYEHADPDCKKLRGDCLQNLKCF